MKFNFSRIAFAATLAAVMAGSAIADQATPNAMMPGDNTSGTAMQPMQSGSNPGSMNPTPPMPTDNSGNSNMQNMPNNPNSPSQPNGMMGSPPPAQGDSMMMGPDGLPQDNSTTMTAPPPGKSMAPPAGPMGPQNSPPPVAPQSKVAPKIKGKQVSKR